MSTIEILTSIVLILASVICFALIYFVYKINKSVYSVSLDIEAISYKLTPLIESMIIGSEKLIHITNEVESQLQITRSMLGNIREHADKVLDVESKIRGGIENVVMPIIKNISAVGIGVRSFWKSYKHK